MGGQNIKFKNIINNNLIQGSVLIGGIIRAVMGKNMFFKGFFEWGIEQQFLVVLFIEFQIIGSWVLIVFSLSLVLVGSIWRSRVCLVL